MLDLSKAVLHAKATIAGDGPIVITTDLPLWSYAASLPVDPRQGGALKIKGRVTQGKIGLLLVSADGTSAISSERALTPEWSGEVEIAFTKQEPGRLVVRNHDDGSASIFELQAVTYSKPTPITSPLAPWSDEAGARSRPSRDLFDLLRVKWSEVPAGLMGRQRTMELGNLSDQDLLTYWRRAHAEATQGEGFAVRGWFHHIYSEMLRGKSVMDVGSGLGIDGLTLARAGARMTFVDIAQENLEILKRLCRILSIEDAEFLYLEDLSSLDRLPRNFDAIWCQGSMINAPFQFMRLECERLLEHLAVGGRWIELCYPYERWDREGQLPFSEWGVATDGAGTPWMEWYDLDRLLQRLKPAEMTPLLAFNFYNDDFNWFDLLRTG